MAFAPEQTVLLKARLDPAVVKKNPKGHDYIEGWHAIAEANRIFGFAGWDRQTTCMMLLGEPYETKNSKGDLNWRVGYRANVRVTVFAGERTIIRDGTGYGSGIGKDLNDAHESASKEAETDAMKRALMTFGNPFGLALYDKARANVGHDDPAIPSEALATFAASLNPLPLTSAALNKWLNENAPYAETLSADEITWLNVKIDEHRARIKAALTPMQKAA